MYIRSQTKHSALAAICAPCPHQWPPFQELRDLLLATHLAMIRKVHLSFKPHTVTSVCRLVTELMGIRNIECKQDWLKKRFAFITVLVRGPRARDY